MTLIILFFAALVACLGTVASAGNTTLRKAAYAKCEGPYKHGIRLHVFDIIPTEATSGITNKNAADTLGDYAFIFGSKGFPSPRGVKDYYNGIIQMRHLSVSSWGDYLQCNHPDGSTVYSCTCPKDHKGACDMERPGFEKSSHTNGHTWYSFPHAGQGKYWDYEHGKGCDSIMVHASCIIKKLAEAAGCSDQCPDPKGSAKKASACVQCVNWLSGKVVEHVWDEATFGKGCPDSRRRRGGPAEVWSYPEEMSNVTVSSVMV